MINRLDTIKVETKEKCCKASVIVLWFEKYNKEYNMQIYMYVKLKAFSTINK